MEITVLALTLASLTIWAVLLLFRGQFWRADQRLPERPNPLSLFPSVAVIVPARDEAGLIGAALKSLLNQEYPDVRSIILVDDNSSDGTADIARQAAADLNMADRLEILTSQPLPAGWTGKLWAMEQGIRHAQSLIDPPDFFMFTDADIEHTPRNLTQLMEKAGSGFQMVSLMVLLNCQSFWEKLLVPAFVFFFQKLYPFRWVNDPQLQLAAAAGGCILIRRDALTRIGGLQSIKSKLIDDCSLARAIKGDNMTAFQSSMNFILPLRSKPLQPIWLGLTRTNRSLRSHPDLSGIWNMVARTAFTQLDYSPVLLGLTMLGMALIYVLPPVSFVWGLVTCRVLIMFLSAVTCILMGVAFRPTLKLYRLSPVWAFALPAAGFLYSLMTLHSAVRHWRGKGGRWRGRTYPGPRP